MGPLTVTPKYTFISAQRNKIRSVSVQFLNLTAVFYDYDFMNDVQLLKIRTNRQHLIKNAYVCRVPL